VLSIVVILALLLAACGGDDDDDDETPEQAAQTPAAASPTAAASPEASPEGSPAASPEGSPAAGVMPDVTPPTVQSPPEDEIGVVEIAPGDPLVLAWALVVTGADESLGIDSRRGVEIAIDDLGAELLGHPIELIGEDTLCTAEGGQAAATKLAANDEIVAIVGTSCSSEARVLAPVIDEAGMVMVSPSNTAPDLTDPELHVDGYLRVAHNDEVQGAVAADFVFNTLGMTTVATIHDGSLYAEQLALVFAESIEEMGGEVVAQEAVAPTDTDMRPVLTRIAAEEPELIYYPIFTAAGGFVTRQAKEVSGLEDTILMGADGLFSDDFIQAAGEGSVGMYLSSPDFSAFPGGYQGFLEKHQAKYGEAPLSAFHAHAYDSTMMIAAAIQQVASQGSDGTLYIPRQALRDALYATANFQGLTGNLTCGETGDCGDPKIAVYEVISTDISGWPDSVLQKVFPE
jgi:branched-chain amino acid transport system substrate-binding protein